MKSLNTQGDFDVLGSCRDDGTIDLFVTATVPGVVGFQSVGISDTTLHSTYTERNGRLQFFGRVSTDDLPGAVVVSSAPSADCTWASSKS